MKLRMNLIDAREFTPLDENSYGENILRDDSERGYFMTQIYFRDSRRRIQIPAFSIIDAPSGNFSLEFGSNFDGTNRRKFTEKNGWYFNSFDDNEAPLGWSTAGLTYIFIVKDGEIYGEPHRLLVVPDRKECEAMIREILFIRHELFQKSDSQTNLPVLRDVKNWAQVLQNLCRHVEELFSLLKRIDERPRHSLQKFQSNCRPSKIRRFDSKIFQQYLESPSRQSYRVLTNKVSTNIFENRLLLNKITRLREFVVEHSRQQISNAKAAGINLEAQTKYVKSFNARFAEEKKLAENTLANLRSLQKTNDENFHSSPEKIIALLDECLALPFFKNVDKRNERWRMTQIFTNDANYRRAYAKLKALDEIFDFSFAADENSLPAEKMWQIYEWWVLAKIVELLVVKLNWRVDDKNDNPAEILRALFDNLENIQRAHIRLTHENPAMTLELFYNTKISESLNAEGCNLRPDYLFKITAGGNAKIFILDAKYRNYQQQGFNYWLEKDLRGICADKYMAEIKNSTGVEIAAAFIVHSDRTPDASQFLGRYVVYNVTSDLRCRNFFSDLNGANQQVGSFYLLPNVEDSAPNQSELNLSLFFKLIFEYFMRQWRTCWECDTPAKVEEHETLGKYPKYYMRCEKCGAFWVKSHCGNCEAHPPLVKHALNYHVEKGGKWYVLCPSCRNE